MVNVAEDRNTPMEPSDEALCRRAADGSREAEEALVRRYSGLVRSCARPLFLAGGDSEDLIQEGMFGLIRAIREYDGAKAASFRTFAEVCIRNRLISALRAASRDKHSPLNQSVPLDTPFFDGNSYPLGALRASSADPEELIIDRDRVAEAMQVNKTKLANLSAIKNGLKVPGIRRAWEEGRLPEAAALEIARMDDNTQYRLLDWMIDNGKPWAIKNVQEFVKTRAKDEQAAEDEKYIELLGHIRERLERELRGCKNREEGIETLKKAFRWAGGGSKEFDWQGEAKGLRLRGEDRKCILRPWATVWDMLAAMSMQDGPVQASETREKIKSKEERNEELLALRWHESDVEPPDGAHIVFIDESGIVDDDEYIDGRLKSGYDDWDEVLLWTLHPDDPSPAKAASSPGWLPLDAEHWPEEGALVVLSYPTGLGGSAYLTARCCGGVSDQYPFISTDAGISVQDIVECQCDSWLLISERQRGRKDDCEACKASHPQCNKCCKACDDPCNAAQWCRKDEK